MKTGKLQPSIFLRFLKQKLNRFYTVRMRFAAIEGGGTSWVVTLAVDSLDSNFVDRTDIVTETPDITLGKIREWLRNHQFDAAGIASFGPVDCKEGSPTYGFITSTPKPNWANTDVLGLLGFRDEFKDIPFKFDTDVNAPALAEFHFHNRENALSCAYVTVGTGIGVGIVANGKSVKGLLHPEVGHIQVKRHPEDDFKGTCPYHGDCVEGMCNNIACALRAGIPATELPNLSDEDPIWDKAAYYIAQMCATLVLVASPEHISLGGGIFNRACLYPKIRVYVRSLLNGYIQHDNITTDKINDFISPSYWGSKAGIVGAAYLAQIAWEERTNKN